MKEESVFLSDEGFEDETTLTVFYGGNLDWYFRMDDPKRQQTTTFRVCTSGGRLPGVMIFVAALLFEVGQGNRKGAIEKAEALLSWLKSQGLEP